MLLLGGDLAYPNPSSSTYEQRLFMPFEDALPTPIHCKNERVVIHKNDMFKSTLTLN